MTIIYHTRRRLVPAAEAGTNVPNQTRNTLVGGSAAGAAPTSRPQGPLGHPFRGAFGGPI